jgi:hypothetical protein
VIPPEGVVVWHVKQLEDGTSFLLSPIELGFDAFKGTSDGDDLLGKLFPDL